MVGSMVDLTDRKRLEAQLRQAQKMEAVGQLAGGVAHDFNNLLTVITAGTRFAREALPPESPAIPDLATVDAAAQRAAQLTRQLLAFGRQQVLRPQAVDLNRIAADVGRMLRRTIGEDVAVVTALAPAVAPVRADPGQLEQVLMNLAVNARDAMPDGGTLTIETTEVAVDAREAAAHPGLPPGAYVCLRVRDTGTGMDAATRERAFEPFFTTKPQGQGTGLGLATVYGIVKQSGGYVYVESAPGAGSTFTVLLPPDPSTARPVDVPAPERAPAGGGEVVLVVEDEAAVRAAVRRMLERGGYTVIEAEHGTAALALVGRYTGRLDLVLTDVVMPETGGGALLARLRDLRPGLPALLMSGYSAEAVARQGVLVEGATLLVKPFGSEELLRRVREALGPA
jgi:nitrogen-specific signal transduction histidine kinase